MIRGLEYALLPYTYIAKYIKIVGVIAVGWCESCVSGEFTKDNHNKTLPGSLNHRFNVPGLAPKVARCLM